MISEVGIIVSLEDSVNIKAGQIISYWTTFGEISERERILFSVGSESVEYRGHVFHRETEKTFMKENLAVREMKYCKVNS